MDLFSFLKVSMPELTPEDTKIHFAAHNGTENPLDVFLAGEFDQLPEQAFYMVGSIEQAVERAAKL